MKLLQLNIWMGKLTWAATRLVEKEQPDIICLQEVFDSRAGVVIPDRQYICLQMIQEASGLDYVFFSPTLSTDVADGTAEWGNAILSRYPLTFTETIFTHGEFTEHHQKSNDVSNTRNMQIAEMQLDNGQRLTVINHHAHWELTPLGSDTTIEKMNLVAERAKQVETPLILAGDLNIIHDSPAMRVFDGWLDDPITKTDVKTTLSGVGRPLDVVCDHILISQEITMKSIEAKDEIVSDHKALVMEFEV